MPTVRHFWKRQNWQRLRLLLSTGQSLFVRQTYLEFFWTVRCKKERQKKELTEEPCEVLGTELGLFFFFKSFLPECAEPN